MLQRRSSSWMAVLSLGPRTLSCSPQVSPPCCRPWCRAWTALASTSWRTPPGATPPSWWATTAAPMVSSPAPHPRPAAGWPGWQAAAHGPPTLASSASASCSPVLQHTAPPELRHAGGAGNNSPQIAPPTGAPAIAVPMGYNEGGLPASLQILARPFAEGTAIRVAYAYEQATLHRR